MAGMFSEKNTKQIPKTLDDCIRENTVVSELRVWVERIEKWGIILLTILIIVGVVSTIIEAVSVAEINEDMVFPTIVSSLITWGFYAAIEYFAFQFFALLISALATITQHTVISAQVALFESTKNSTNPDNTKTDAPQAAKSAQETQPKTGDETIIKPIFNEDNSWKCPACGRNNVATRTTCWCCDAKRA